MSRFALGRLLLACLLMTCVAIGQAAVEESKPAKKMYLTRARKGQAIRRLQLPRRRRNRRRPTRRNRPLAKEAPAEPSTQKLKKGPFCIELSLDGVFKAQNQAELFVRPREWTALAVLKAVEHGAVVKQGDMVLVLDTEKIDRVITDLRSELDLNELALKQASAQVAALEKIAPLEAQANSRSRRIIEEDWKQFQEVEKPQAAKMADFRLKEAQEPGICRGGISSTRKDV